MLTIDDSKDTLPLSSVCTFCKHLRDTAAHTCDAFPKKGSIPEEIWIGDNDHKQPVEGDHGIQFEPLDEHKALDLERWERKALRRFKERGRADTPFESDAIPLPDRERISAALKAAQSVDDVRRAFKAEDEIDALLADVDDGARAWAGEVVE